MVAVLRGWAVLFTGPEAAVLRGVIAAAGHDDVPIERLVDQVQTPVVSPTTSTSAWPDPPTTTRS